MMICVDDFEIIRLKVISLRHELEALEERLEELKSTQLEAYNDLIDHDCIYDITSEDWEGTY